MIIMPLARRRGATIENSERDFPSLGWRTGWLRMEYDWP